MLKNKKMAKQCHANIYQRKARMTILISDKVEFRAKKITRERGILYNTKRVNPPKRHYNIKCLHTKQ